MLVGELVLVEHRYVLLINQKETQRQESRGAHLESFLCSVFVDEKDSCRSLALWRQARKPFLIEWHNV